MVDKKDVDYNPVTAADAVAAYTDPVDAEGRELAEQEGVVSASHVDYEKALKNYESRSDVETLEARRARENGTTFDAASFRRDANVDEAGLLSTKGGEKETGPKAKEKNPDKDTA